MMPQDTDRMFNFRFEKTCFEIKQAALEKINQLKEKITERLGRLAKLREEYQIDDAALAQLLIAARRQAQSNVFTYHSNSTTASGSNRMEEKTIGAGVVNNLLTESDFVESDRANVKRLVTIVDNIRPLPRITGNGTKYEEDSINLTYAELEFLGF